MTAGIFDAIGKTPLVKLHGLDAGCCSVFLKLEYLNPGGSIKDRIGREMVAEAEASGLLLPGGTIVEATAGNTGFALALAAAERGYKLILVIPDKMSREKIALLRAFGAKIVLTRSDVERGHPAYYQDLARSIAAETPGAWYADQFSNPANPRAHELTTGPEIFEQIDGDLDAIVVGIGSGGTLGGLTRFFSKAMPELKFIVADPEGSVIAPYLKTGDIPQDVGSWLVEGIGEDFIPSVADFSMVKAAYSISDKEGFSTVRELLKTNGILAGTSTGTLLAAALRWCREQKEPRRVLTFACDSGSRYASKVFNDNWMVEQGFLSRPHYGDLRDLISRPFSEGLVVSASPDEPLYNAYRLMKLHDISQLPVLEGSAVVGLLDESDLLLAVHRDRRAMTRSIKQFMSSGLKAVRLNDGIEDVFALLEQGFVAIVRDEERFYGIITRLDLIDYLKVTI